MTGKAEILARLQREILPLQGLRSAVNSTPVDTGLGAINASLPNGALPLGAVHEFISSCAEDHTASAGFVAALAGPLLKKGGTALWISADRTLFPPALKNFGIEPDRLIFIDIRKPKDLAWAMDEALKCGALSAVIGELPDLGFTASRRLQLSVEQSQVTAFILRRNPKNLSTTACVTRWKIRTLPSETIDGLPGVGFPQWNVELLKVRNGKPGSWKVKWSNGKMEVLVPDLPAMEEIHLKSA
ncbi:MAG: Error-prone repair protein ImuA [Chitinophagaceae bacterium]|nr:MAG: Error-prone repair protein ImuA [Chitinophagaceae bacterium]